MLRAGSAPDLLRTVFLQLRFDPLGKKYLHQRLVGNVVLVRRQLELLEHRFGNTPRFAVDQSTYSVESSAARNTIPSSVGQSKWLFGNEMRHL